MEEFEGLKNVLGHITGLSAKQMDLSKDFWTIQNYEKGEYFNNYQQVCRQFGFILEGAFRGYLIDHESGDERNVFLYAKNNFIVSYRSFIDQAPCDYYTQALNKSQIISISYQHLQLLYDKSHDWERLGRIIAQEAFKVTLDRVENFVLRSPEDRYLKLLNDHPEICQHVPLQHIASFLGIHGASLSRIRNRISKS